MSQMWGGQGIQSHMTDRMRHFPTTHFPNQKKVEALTSPTRPLTPYDTPTTPVMEAMMRYG